MLLKLAWRNIWRNKRRTIISLLALALGVMAIVSIHSFQEVAYTEMIRSLTSGLVGHAQVHGRGYQESPGPHHRRAAIPGPSSSGSSPSSPALRPICVSSVRVSADRARSRARVMVMGIEPDKPRARALLTIEKGRGLGPTPAREAVIGTGLADELRLAPGGELVLVGQAADGSLANDRFTVVGTGDAGSSEASASAVFLHLADAQSFFSLGRGVHEVVVHLPVEQEDLRRPVSLLRAALDQDALEVLPWTEMVPELKSAIDAKRRNTRLIDLVVFLIVALGILNTMTMSTFERTREFGVLASLGTRRGRILAMVALETLLQGLIGFAAGLVLAAALLYGIGTADITSMGGNADVLGVRLPGTLALSLDLAAVLKAALTTVLIMLAGGLVPALRASRSEAGRGHAVRLMRTILKVAWRSIWRNRRRTLISMSAVGIGLVLVIFYSGLLGGALGDAKQQLDNVGMGHVEITAPGWRTHRAATESLADPESLLARLDLPERSEVGWRVVARGLVSSARASEGVELQGVDWAKEEPLSAHLRDIRQGRRPEAGDDRGILIGEKLADRLKVKLGSKLRVMVQRADGELGADLYRVRGIFHSLSPAISERRVLVNASPRASSWASATWPISS